MYEKLQEIESITLNFSTDGLFVLNLTLAIIMFGVALDIKISNFKKLFYSPKSLIIGVISQFLILPAVTFGLVMLLGGNITQGIALGMILVAACPGGNISNFIASMAKANTELSVSLTAVATILSVFMTPANFAFWGKLYAAQSPLVRPIEIEPVQMFQTVFIILGVPIVLGMLFAWKFPELTQKIRKLIRRLSILIFVAFVVIAFKNNFDYFLKYITLIIFIVLIHNALALFTGYTISTVFKLPQIDRRSITIETGIQNSGLALVLIFNPKIFPANLEMGGMAMIAAWWGIWHIIAGLGIAWFWSRKKTPIFANH